MLTGALYQCECQCCGAKYYAKSPLSRYCSKKCKNTVAWLKHKEAEHAREERQKQAVIDYVIDLRRTYPHEHCKGCVWRSPVDHTKCVMPRCIKGLGSVKK